MWKTCGVLFVKRKAELTAALEECTTTVYGVVTSEKKSTNLGPTISISAMVNGVPTEALVDTGSPVTILSLKFAMLVLSQEQKQFPSKEEWKVAMQERLKTPDIVLRSYGGERLNVLAQLEVTISQGDHKVMITTMVQKDAPSPLLLGTDVLSSLGFYCTFQKPGQTTNLLGKNGNSDNHSEDAETQTTKELEQEEAGIQPDVKDQPIGELQLVEDIKIPSRCKQMIKAVITTAEPNESLDTLLFTPTSLQEGLVMTDTVLSYEGNQYVCTLIENQNMYPVWLEKDLVLGCVESVIELEEEEEIAATGNAAEEATDSNKVSGKEATGNAVEEAEVVGKEATATSNDFVSCVRETGCIDAKERSSQLLEMLNLQVEHLTEEQQKSFTDLLAKHTDIFALRPTELGTTKLVSHHIDTGDHSPIHQPLRRTPFSLRKKINEMIEEMLETGIIQQSSSPWASPIVLVKNKDGTMRFCVDYRKLNHITKPDVFPLPRIDDTLEQLAGAKYFSTLDLASGYWQVSMDNTSQEKTAFSTYAGHYEFKKMPFGLVNAPSTFQRLMEVTLAGLKQDCCLTYLDDVIVIGKSMEEHNQNLVKVFDRLRVAGLKLKPTKCKLAQRSVEYLGHIVSEEGVRTDPKKLQAVSEYPTPADVKSLRSFLGLASYYRRFIPNFAKVAGPLHALTKKDVEYVWTPQCQEVFRKLKELLTSSPVLVFPNFDIPFLLETDASHQGLGAVLAQTQSDGTVRPIAYASRSLQPHEKNYGITELEGLGIVWAVKHFRPYLYGYPCDIYTDHEALKSLLNTPQPSGKLARWGMAIQELDLRILHRTGKSNANADALSRAPVEGTDKEAGSNGVPFGIIAAIKAGKTAVQEDGLSKRQRDDPKLFEVINFLEMGVLPEDEKRAKVLALTKSQYHMEGGVLYRLESDGTLRVIPPTITRRELFEWNIWWSPT